jgi:hypothetical protein
VLKQHHDVLAWSVSPQYKRQALLWLAALATLLFSLNITLVQPIWPSSAFAQLAYLPILLAGAMFDLRGALVVAFIVAILTLPLFENELSQWLQVGSLYLLFGIVVGALFQAVKLKLKKVQTRAEYLSEMYTKMLSSLASTVEVRDRHTRGHCQRVAQNALVIGQAMGLNDHQLDLLYWGAMLHDLGKIAIPEYVLLKDGPLSELEYDKVKQHPGVGAELLSSVSKEFAQIAEVVRGHHERWDGLGYPDRLRGETIPLMSRIISVVDVFEALTSRRPYRQPMYPGEALHYLRNGAGKQFDPKLVAVFDACYAKGEIRCAPEAELLRQETPAYELRFRPLVEPITVD